MTLSYRYKINAKSQTILYVRLPTLEQSASGYRQQAERAGFVIDKVIEDYVAPGGATTLQEREGGKQLLDILREGDALVVRWLDHLGRNYEDIQRILRLLLERGVTIKTVINDMVFDARPKDITQKAVCDALLSFMSAIAEAQAISHKETQAVGIANAKARNPKAYKGRKPSYTYQHVDQIGQMSRDGLGVNEVARRLGLSKFLVSRINKDTTAAYEALKRWGIEIDPRQNQLNVKK
jgi:DNA invertase Pin-like site-specific DNA recombinase